MGVEVYCCEVSMNLRIATWAEELILSLVLKSKSNSNGAGLIINESIRDLPTRNLEPET